MKITETCVKRPVFATMLILSLVVVGIASYFQLGVDLYPKVDLPTVTITTVLEGASPEEVETQVTKPLEEAINTISGIDVLRSTSTEGQSGIYATFVLEKDLDEAVNDVRQKVSANIYKLPKDIESPIIQKVDPDAAPILAILLSGNRDPKEISEIADKQIKRRLQTVPDVGSVDLVGDRKREIQVFIDPNKLFSYNIPIQKVKQAIQSQNIEIPAGRLTWHMSERGLRTLGRAQKVEELENIIVDHYQGTPIKVSDIGYVLDTTEEPRSLARVNGKSGVSLLIRKQSGSNTIEVTDNVIKRIEQLKEILPPDLKLSIVRDQSRFIRKSISEVEHHLILGAIFASLVVLFFMRSFRASLIAAIAIPVSLIATFALMKYMGFTINNLTLLALSICTGIVIDDAIIVLENIFRYVEEKGVTPFKAALEATDEIFEAVVATTLSLIVIFLPIAFMYGTVGRFFKSFGFTAAFAIAISMFVAFTLIPALTARLFKSGVSKKMQKSSKDTLIYSFIDNIYDKALIWSLNHRIVTVIIAILIVLSTPFLFQFVKFEFFPFDDMSEYEVIIQTQPGSSLEKTDQIVREIEEKIKKLPAVKDTFTTIGEGRGTVTNASIYVNLLPLKERTITQEELMKRSRTILKNYPGLRTSVQYVGQISGGGFRRTVFNLVIQGPEIDQLQVYAKTFISNLRQYGTFVDLDTAQPEVSPEVKVSIDREKASELGIDILSIATAMRTMIGGEKVSDFKEGTEQYDVRLRLEDMYRQSIENVQALPIQTASGDLIRLENIATVYEGKSPSQIDHYNMEREVTVVANLEGMALGDAIKVSDKELKKLNLPVEYNTYYMGYGELMGEAVFNFLIAALLSIVFIYIVLAAQFNSFSQPLIIMASIPLSIPFGLLSLIVFNQSLNIDSMIGVLLLFGIVKKNAILQVDYTNTLVKEGKPVKEAIIEADHARLRPILMTTLTIIAGMLPIAVGRGDGSAARASMAILIIGGQALCLGITLLVTPVLYSLFTDIKIFTGNFYEKYIAKSDNS
jgi:HAE1 family hydrophobic/amphiphilic exporter-1